MLTVTVRGVIVTFGVDNASFEKVVDFFNRHSTHSSDLFLSFTDTVYEKKQEFASQFHLQGLTLKRHFNSLKNYGFFSDFLRRFRQPNRLLL